MEVRQSFHDWVQKEGLILHLNLHEKHLYTNTRGIQDAR